MKHAFSSEDVAVTFNGFDKAVRPGLLQLRDLVFEVARADPRIGQIDEALRWGQPAYLTPVTKSGSTLRLGVAKTGEFGLFVHCRTSLIADFKAAFPAQDRTEGNRAVLFDSPARIDQMRHGWLIRRALTYHC